MNRIIYHIYALSYSYIMAIKSWAMFEYHKTHNHPTLPVIYPNTPSSVPLYILLLSIDIMHVIGKNLLSLAENW